MVRKMKSMDGNNAAAHVSYAFSEVAAIYPITPSSPMADFVDQWSANGLKNIFGTQVKVVEMQSEAGAAGAVHGSLGSGALTTTYTASQGLLLMIPNMYKIAAEQLPAVFHVSARTVSTQALNIFGDHSDVMACRQTGFAMLCEGNVQEVMDLSPVAHLAALSGKVPFINFFDGFRTSHEIQKIAVWDYEDLKDMCDMDAVAEFRRHALNPEHPHMRGSHENGDIFFQHREACNKYYAELPAVVEKYMDLVNAKLGTDYKLFNYYGHPEADRVIVAMGSICDVAEEVIDYLNAHGEKVGLVKVRLYRPFAPEKLLEAFPASVKKIAVLDRTKEPGSLGEPLYQDVCTVLREAGRDDIKVVGGRYGLGSKEFTPTMVKAVYENLEGEMKNHFTVGINDDLTGTSLKLGEQFNSAPAGTVSCKFYGLGSDGTVGANKNSIKIIGDHTDKYAQAYFAYDSKKSGGLTVSHLRFGDTPIRSTYQIDAADFIACHNQAYVTAYDMVSSLRDGGTFLLNCQWDESELDAQLPAAMKQLLAKKHAKFYIINAVKLAAQVGMGNRINTIMQAAFFKLADVIPYEQADEYMKAYAKKTYGKKGDEVVKKNWDAIDIAISGLNEVKVPAEWATCTEGAVPVKVEGTTEYFDTFIAPILAQAGDKLPVSMVDAAGRVPTGTTKFEKRGIAVAVPQWNIDACIQCGNCAIVCPHACIRPYLVSEEDMKNAPASFETKPAIGPKFKGYQYRMQVSPLDCTGCENCTQVCPVNQKGAKVALEMKPLETQTAQEANWEFAQKLPEFKGELNVKTVKDSQFKKPLFEFSGACAGCGETPYVKLVTQLFGDRMIIANATGCSSIYGGSAPTCPYTVNEDGHGPAWANSLFEDNAEFGFGMQLGIAQRREKLADTVRALIAVEYCQPAIKEAGAEWLEKMNDAEGSKAAGAKLLAACKDGIDLTGVGAPYEDEWLANGKVCKCEACTLARKVIENADLLTKKSFWIFGGDGWAYDIGYGGLDHVIASKQDVNIFVFDTEVYSNTGGQASKASNIGQVAQFAAAGKEIKKKSLSEIAMQYGYVYVAQVAMGANPAQTIKAITEAEAYHGPSLIIGYSPCEMHSIKGGMMNCQKEMKKAVDCGYWNLFRYNPEGEKKFTLDSKAPAGGYQEFLMNEARYSRLTREFPERADVLFQRNEDEAKARYEHLLKLVEMYDK